MSALVALLALCTAAAVYQLARLALECRHERRQRATTAPEPFTYRDPQVLVGGQPVPGVTGMKLKGEPVDWLPYQRAFLALASVPQHASGKPFVPSDREEAARERLLHYEALGIDEPEHDDDAMTVVQADRLASMGDLAAARKLIAPLQERPKNAPTREETQ